jgi:hypothetical protein
LIRLRILASMAGDGEEGARARHGTRRGFAHAFQACRRMEAPVGQAGDNREGRPKNRLPAFACRCPVRGGKNQKRHRSNRPLCRERFFPLKSPALSGGRVAGAALNRGAW